MRVVNVLLSRELAPSKMPHILVLVLSGPHDLALPQCTNVRWRDDEPHYHQQNRQSTAYAVDRWARVGGPKLYRCKGHTGLA